MAEENSRERRSIWRVGPDSTWTTVLPVAFIIVSLLSLVVLPLVVANHTAKMRQEITRVAEPARRSANAIQVDLSAELDKIIAFQVTGQGQYRREYEALLQRQIRNRDLLRKLAPQLDGELDRDLETLFQQGSRWHDAIARGEFLTRSLPHEVFLTRVYEAHPAYEKALLAATDLELAIQGGIEARLQRIRQAERINVSLTIVLTLLALTSALLVAGLGRQMRLLAREAMRRRQEAEREANEAKVARTSAEREERRAAFLAAAGRELTASLDYDETIHTLAKLVVPNLAELCAIDLAEGDGTLRRAAVAHRNRDAEAALAETINRGSRDVPEAVVRIMHGREPRLIGGTSPLISYFTGDDTPRSMIIVTLVSRGQTLGIIAAAASEARPFSQDDLAIFTELATHASLAIDNARLYLESQQAVRAREEVLAIVSHDLRNPLNAVTLGSSLLQMSETLSDEDRQQIDTIEVSAKRMARLIEDLLDVTRLEGGKQLPIELAPLEVVTLFDEIHEIFRAQAAASEITFQLRPADALPRVYADRHRVMQVLSNLIGNSMKFTPAAGMITVSAEARDGKVLFTVRDTGPGIPHENLKDIFNPYWQAKRAERLGAGLGLPIAKGIVEAHGGTIWVESTPGVGTTFFFTLPVARDARQQLTLEAESPARR